MDLKDFNSLTRSYVLSQLRDVKGFKETLQAIANQYTDLQSKVQFIYNYIDIDTAEGDILDLKGLLFGIIRNYFDISQYFKVNSLDINTSKYFFFEKPQSDTIVPAGILNDIIFRARIKAKIAHMFNNYTRNDNIFIIKNMTFSDNVIITKQENMNLNVHLYGSNIFLTSNTRGEIESILGDGVGLDRLLIN